MIAAYAFALGALAGYLEGKSYSLTMADSTDRKPFWGIVLERIFMPFAVCGLFLIIVFAILAFTGGYEYVSSNAYYLPLFIPGFAIVSTYIVWQRWKEEVRRR